jgi:hypothetical protein
MAFYRNNFTYFKFILYLLCYVQVKARKVSITSQFVFRIFRHSILCFIFTSRVFRSIRIIYVTRYVRKICFIGEEKFILF